MSERNGRRPWRKLKIFLAGLLALVLLAVGAVSVVVFWRDEDGSTFLSEIVARTLSSDGNRVEIGRVEGALSSNIVLYDLTMTDSNGVWLKLDRAELVWNRAALLTRKLSVDRLEIGHLDILRRPVIERSAEQADQDVTASGRGLPDLPVKIVVKKFRMQAARLAAPVLGVPAGLEADGAAELGDPSEGLQLHLALRRMDAPGTVGITLSYVPKGQALSLDIDHDEPAGGLAARLMRIDGLPPVRFTVTGRGVLDDFKATMNYAAGDRLGATGTATLLRDGAGRRLDIRSEARIEALLPQPAAMLVSGMTTIDGRVFFGDDGAITVPGFDIASALAKFRLTGGIGADRRVDLNLMAGAVSGSDGKTRAADGELAKLELSALVRGAINAPAIEMRFEIAGLKTPEGRLDSGSATLLAAPSGGETVDPAQGASPFEQRWELRADATFEGFSTAGRQWSDAVGSSMKLAFHALRDENGLFDVRFFDLATPTVKAAYAGTVSGRRADGILKIAVPDLSAFAGVADRGLRGSVEATSRLSGSIDKSLNADTAAVAEGLFLDIPAMDGLLQGGAALNGRVEIARDRIGFAAVRLTAAHVNGTLDGSIGRDKADSRLQLVVDDLSKADSRLKGRLTADGSVTGNALHPDLRLTLTADGAAALAQPVRRLTLDIAAKDIRGALDAHIDLQGDIGNRPLSGNAHVQRLGDENWKLDGLAFSFGSVALDGALTAGNGLLDGRLRINANDLGDLSALVLTKMAGTLNADMVLTSSGEAQGIRLIAKGRDISTGTAAIRLIDADMTVADLFRKPAVSGFLNGSGWVAESRNIETVDVRAREEGGSSAITLQAKTEGLDLNARAAIASSDRIRVTLNDLSARRGQRSLVLTRPATFALAGGIIEIPALAMAANGTSGQVSLAGNLGAAPGRDSDLTVSFQKLPLAVAGLAAPALDLGGTLDGRIRLTGPIARPQGDYDLDIRGATTSESRMAGLPPIDTGLKGRLLGDRTTFDGTVTMGRVGQVALGGSVPFDPRGRMDVRARGRLNAAAAANTVLSASGQQITGAVDIDGAVSGSMMRPSVSGQAALSNGGFTDSLRGVRLSNIQGRMTGQGETIVVERLTAQTRNNGSITVSGRIEVDPARGFPGSFRVDASRAELVSSQLVTAVSNMALTMSGPLTQRPQIAGRIDLIRMDVTLPSRLPATVQPLPNARHIDPPPNVRARLEAERKARERASRTPPFDAELNLSISAPNQIFIRGQGVDAEVGGELRITGSSRSPNVTGGFDMRRGRLTIIGQRLDFTRGRLTFSGEMLPELDFLAQTQAGGVVASVAVTGLANQPSFTLSSTPELPQDEVLSRLLFAKSSGSLSPFQALQLAQAVAQLSGTGGVDVFNDARKALGLDSLDITSGSGGGLAVGASRYINDRISVGVRAGANPQDNAATINMDITKRLRLQGEVGASGNTSVGVGAEWEY